MATVQVVTAQRTLEIEADTIVGGELDENGHLILTKGDGTTIDAGSVMGSFANASDDVAGMVELATDAETAAGTDSSRAVTPLGLSSVMSSMLAAGAQTVLQPGTLNQTSPLSAYPTGYSRIQFNNVNGAGWDFEGSFGEIVTFRAGTDYARQFWFRHQSGSGINEMWFRTANGSSGWAEWNIVTNANLDTIAWINPANDSILQRKAGSWVGRTMSQLAADLQGTGEFVETQIHNGTIYTDADSTKIYVGPTDPGGVPNGSVWFDTTGA